MIILPIIYSIKQIIKNVYINFTTIGKLRFYSSCNLSVKSKFEGANKIGQNSFFRGNIGYGSYIGPNCFLNANIGRFTSIAPYVRNNNGIHPYTFPYATTCPMFFSTQKQNGEAFADKMMFDEFAAFVEIGNDCWIGENAFLVGGIKIGDGAVVLARAVVTKDVPPYAIVGGIPAKILRYRYDVDTINFLLEFKWWNRDISWFKDNWKFLCNIDGLKEYVKSMRHE